MDSLDLPPITFVAFPLPVIKALIFLIFTLTVTAAIQLVISYYFVLLRCAQPSYPCVFGMLFLDYNVLVFRAVNSFYPFWVWGIG